MVKKLVILGSTGSIGTQTLDVIRAFPEDFKVYGLAARHNSSLLLQQVWEFRPEVVYCQSGELKTSIPQNCEIVSGLEDMVTAPGIDMVMQAMVGSAGLLPTLAALARGTTVALANKEPVVIAGDLLFAEARRTGAPLYPVDSEPSAIWQCLRGEDSENAIRRLLITASGGPFRESPLENLEHVTPKEALQHPTWHMGPKITVDSATLMNKGFEVIEAHWFFNLDWDQLQVVIHPQSVIHSMVEFKDGSVKAQMGPPDMRLPIQYALFYPERRSNNNLSRFDPFSSTPLTFAPMDISRYPCFGLALEAGRLGGTYPAVLSASDEVAVDLFLQGRIGFLDIPRLVGDALGQHDGVSEPTVEDILSADSWARRFLSLAVTSMP
jgi:1-deoxy-D-xylulose-5-phosphate reductoisomerase